MRRLLMSAVAVAVAAATVAGCGGGSKKDNPLDRSGGGDQAGGTKTVTVYTSEPDTDINAMIEAFNEKYPDIKVKTFRSGTEQVLSKIEAEKKAGALKADVVFIADALSMEKLKGDDLLQKYTSPNAKGIDEQYMDPEGYYEGTKVIATGLAINTDDVKKAPDSWDVLTKPVTKGKAVMPSPLYSGAAAYNVALFAGKSDFGWQYWKGVADNGTRVVQGNGSVLEAVSKGQQDYGMVVGFIVARAAEQGSPVKFIYPREGVPVITEPIALMKKAPHAKASKKFIDFVFSPAGQQVESGLGYVPLDPDAKVPNGLTGVDDINVMSGDTQKLITKVEGAKSKFKNTFN
ncbi:MAG: ABC transporter substrate-binding protein [Streptosporangiales bacterium]